MTTRRCWNPRPHTIHEWKERGVRFDCDGRPFQPGRELSLRQQVARLTWGGEDAHGSVPWDQKAAWRKGYDEAMRQVRTALDTIDAAAPAPVASRSAAEPQTGSATPDDDGFDVCPEPTCSLYGKAVMADHRHLDTPAARRRREREERQPRFEIAADYARCTVALHFDPDQIPNLVALFPDRADTLHRAAAQVEAEVEARILETRDRQIGGQR